MLVLNDPLRQTDLPRGCIATIGNFDGMHIGHQEIIRGVVDEYLEGAGFRCCFAPIRCPVCRSKAPSGVDLLRGKSAR